MEPFFGTILVLAFFSMLIFGILWAISELRKRKRSNILVYGTVISAVAVAVIKIGFYIFVL